MCGTADFVHKILVRVWLSGWVVGIFEWKTVGMLRYLPGMLRYEDFGSGYLSCVHAVMSFFGLKCLKCLNVLEVDCLPAVLGVVEGSCASARCDEKRCWG